MRNRITAFRFLLFLLVLIIFVPTSMFFFRVSDFYFYLNGFSGNVARGDVLSVTKSLDEVRYFYRLNEKHFKPIGLDRRVGEMFFSDALLYQASLDYLAGNCKKVIKEMENESGFWPNYLIGNCEFRKARGVFKSGLDEKNKKKREEKQQQADELAVTTIYYYEEALREGLKNQVGKINWNRASWNYDIATNPGARRAALAPKPGKIVVMLGYGGKNKKGPKGKKGGWLKRI